MKSQTSTAYLHWSKRSCEINWKAPSEVLNTVLRSECLRLQSSCPNTGTSFAYVAYVGVVSERNSYAKCIPPPWIANITYKMSSWMRKQTMQASWLVVAFARKLAQISLYSICLQAPPSVFVNTLLKIKLGWTLQNKWPSTVFTLIVQSLSPLHLECRQSDQKWRS